MKRIVTTYRKDQATYKAGDGSDPKQLIGGVRGYLRRQDRDAAVTQMAKRGWNHFVYFRDVQSEFAMSFYRKEIPRDYSP